MAHSITIKDFYARMQQTKLPILDVREENEFQRGHVPHATNLPLSQLDQLLPQLDSTKQYYVICQSGRRSKKACKLLSKQGYKVINVLGGTNAWPGELIH